MGRSWMRAGVVFLALSASSVAGAVPMKLAHQGVIQVGGVPLDGPHDLVVRIYNHPSQGSVVWQESLRPEFTGGVYTVLLGTDTVGNPLDPDDFGSDDLWVGIAVDGGAELASRVPLVSVPFAIRADTAGAVTGDVSWSQIVGIPAEIADGTDGDTLATLALTCDPDQILRWNNGTATWFCSDDRDTKRTDAEIRTAVGGSPVNLATGSTLNGTAIATLPLSWNSLTGIPASIGDGFDDDTLAALAVSCDDDQVVAWDDATTDWTCRDDVDTVLSGAQVRAEIAGQTIAPARVQMTGPLVLGTPASCTDDGALRWSGSEVQVCVGGAWQPLGRVDRIPNPVTFSGSTTTLATSATSGAVTVSGFDGTLAAFVSGAGEPLLSVNGGAFAPGATVQSGDSVQLRATSPATVGSRVIALTLGDHVTTWTVTATAPNATCKTILDAGQGSTNGTYTIDPDGPGGADPISVYCDMVAGGWTYAAQGVPFRIPHTGGPVQFLTPVVSTTYEFTAYGAAGGPQGAVRDSDPNNSYRPRAFGGMAKGQRTFAPRSTLFAYVGGMGQGGDENDRGVSLRSGGFNGGGGASRGGSSGGGATDVRLGDALLTSRFIVAGGGGGCGYEYCTTAGGAGGGLTGATGGTSPTGAGGTGGSQTAGGAPQIAYTADAAILAVARGGFGYGGSAIQINDEGGGGGGWYGGGAGGHHNTTGGGGSSYVAGVTGSTTTAGVNNGHGYLDYIFR